MGSFLDTPRTERKQLFGCLDRVLNRGVGRMTLFEEVADCRAFLGVGAETLRLVRMSICGCCAMLNPAYFLLWTVFHDGLSSCQQRLTNTHVQRWQHQSPTTGDGEPDRGRCQSFSVRGTTPAQCSVTSSEMPCGLCGPSGLCGPTTDASRAARRTGVGRAFRGGDP